MNDKTFAYWKLGFLFFTNFALESLELKFR